jgi:hypothetical protein
MGCQPDMGAKFVRFPALVAVSPIGQKSSGHGVSILMSSNKTPTTRRKSASRCRGVWSPSYDHQRVVDDFWTDAIGEDFESQSGDAEFVHGFADGALEVWAEVADKL